MLAYRACRSQERVAALALSLSSQTLAQAPLSAAPHRASRLKAAASKKDQARMRETPLVPPCAGGHCACAIPRRRLCRRRERAEADTLSAACD